MKSFSKREGLNGALLQLHRPQLFRSDPSFLSSCFFPPLGMATLRSFAACFTSERGATTNHVAAKVNGTALVFGRW